MKTTLHVLSRILGSLALAAMLGAPAPADARCLQFDFTRPWTALQSNGYRVQFTLHQQQPTVAGVAEYCDASGCTRGRVTGTLNGASISLYTGWGGLYDARVDASGRLVGSTFDGNDIHAARANWWSNRRLECLVERDAPVGGNDFNGDRNADIVWHNERTGETQLWLLSSHSRIGRAGVTDGPHATRIGPPWHLVGSRDFNRDHKADLLWHNDTTHETQLWFMDGSRLDDRATVRYGNGDAALVRPPWRIVGTHDMNGDGLADIVWHNSDNGTVQVWLMDRHQITRRPMVVQRGGAPLAIESSRTVAAVADMDHDGLSDLVLHDTRNGSLQVVLLKGLEVTQRVPVRSQDGRMVHLASAWRITGANDFDRDGFGDLLLHNTDTGETQQWLMQRDRIVDRVPVNAERDGGGALVGAPWQQMHQ